MALNPPQFNSIVLRRAPLTLVVSQLRFTSILSIQRQEFIAEFQEAIREDYPILEQQQGIQVQLLPPPPTPPILETSTLWRFLSPDSKWIAALAPEFLSLETTAYSTLADFVSRFEKLLTALLRCFRPSQQIRLGLRYINEFRNPGRANAQDWQGFINPALLGAWISDPFGSVEQARQEIRVRQDDGWFMLRFALRHEGPEQAPVLILDFDYYDEGQRQLDQSDVLEKLVRYNDVIYRMFRWAIRKPLLDEFEARDENT